MCIYVDRCLHDSTKELCTIGACILTDDTFVVIGQKQTHIAPHDVVGCVRIDRVGNFAVTPVLEVCQHKQL